MTWGLYLFLHTRLGSYLWELCSGRPVLPEFAVAAREVQACGMPVPNPTILADLSLFGSPEEQAVPDPETLEREFANIFGTSLDLPAYPLDSPRGPTKSRRRSIVSAEQIAAKVFVDGIPRFPEHYLMHLYRPALAHYDFSGPLEIAAEFFDRVSLRTIDREQTLQVSGGILADALVLASYNGATGVDLPRDDRLLGDLAEQYRSDLQHLWDNLIRECRRCEPRLQAAIKLARKIWQRQGLPPDRVLRNR